MNLRTLSSLLIPATLFLSVAAGQTVSTTPALADAPSAIGQQIFGPALAPPQPHERALTAQEQALLERFDSNHDGKLEQDELDEAHGVMLKQRRGREVQARRLYNAVLEKFDTDHQGRLTPDQQMQAMAFLKENRPQAYQALVKQFDRNGDGDLNSNETAAAFQYMSYLPDDLAKGVQQPNAEPGKAANVAGEGARRAMVRQIYSHLLESFDREHKGSLSPDEQSEAVDYLQANNPRIYERMLQRFDADGDGKLDKAEIQKMFDALAKTASEPAPAAAQ